MTNKELKNLAEYLCSPGKKDYLGIIQSLSQSDFERLVPLLADETTRLIIRTKWATEQCRIRTAEIERETARLEQRIERMKGKTRKPYFMFEA